MGEHSELYEPAPLDSSRVRLSAELESLVEPVARNNHELWARRCMAESGRDSALLVRFDELPAAEKDRYLEIARETVRAILTLGGSVQPPRSSHPHHSEASAPQTLEQYRDQAARTTAEGECLAACDIAGEGLRYWPSDVRLRQLRALALARMGSHDAAREIVLELAAEASDEETLGLLARTHKDLWLESGDPGDLDRAYQSYAAAYASHPGRYWTGINAATLAFARGEPEIASRLAGEVRAACQALLPAAAPDSAERYWITSTLAEAALVRGEIEEACRLYAEASAAGRQADLGNLSSTLRNARILLRHLSPEATGRVEEAIGMPGVAVFSGHRADQPGRPQPRFPNACAPAVGEAIRKCLIESHVRVGYASAAAGGDLLFLEALQGIGGRIHIVLPCSRQQFIAESVAPSGAEWVQRFERVIAEANEVITASEEHLSIGSVGYDYANQLLHGLALARARQFGVPLCRIAVWDGEPGLPAGTGDVVTSWRSGGHSVRVIDPLTAAIAVKSPEPAPRVRPQGSAGFSAVTRSMIFADAHHFSKLSEAQMPEFIHRFMGLVASVVEAANPATVFQNTWGDGLFLVFENAPDAGRFAIRLAREVNAIDRAAAGLPATLNLRIALHVGPVYQFYDRIIGRPNFIGSHVNRAARMEPVTPAGQVYGTHAFAAIAALEAPGEFRCDYVGRVALAKGFGDFAMYRVQAGAATTAALAARSTGH